MSVCKRDIDMLVARLVCYYRRWWHDMGEEERNAEREVVSLLKDSVGHERAEAIHRWVFSATREVRGKP
jgi:hypothetical protein